MVINSEIDDNSPIGEVFGKLFDTIVMIASKTDVVTIDNEHINNKLFNACLEFYCANCGIKIQTPHIFDYVFDVDAVNVKNAEDSLNGFLKEVGVSNFNPIEYFVDEMMCNIKEHSKAEKGLLYYWHSTSKKTIDICVADNGISILGSYVQSQLYLDRIGDSDAKAITLAKKGFSTKNRPDAENRGFGISSNIDMITNGLHGSMYVLSGTGLLMCRKSKTEILSMPAQTEWKRYIDFCRNTVKYAERF